MGVQEDEQIAFEGVVARLPRGEIAEPQNPSLEDAELVVLAADEAALGQRGIAERAVDDDLDHRPQLLGNGMALWCAVCAAIAAGRPAQAAGRQEQPEAGPPRACEPNSRDAGREPEREEPEPDAVGAAAVVEPLDHAEHQFGLARLERAEIREDRRVGEGRDAALAVVAWPRAARTPRSASRRGRAGCG